MYVSFFIEDENKEILEGNISKEALDNIIVSTEPNDWSDNIGVMKEDANPKEIDCFITIIVNRKIMITNGEALRFEKNGTEKKLDLLSKQGWFIRKERRR